jgi:hypothetical protein
VFGLLRRFLSLLRRWGRFGFKLVGVGIAWQGGMLFVVELGGRSFVELAKVRDGWGGVVV